MGHAVQDSKLSVVLLGTIAGPPPTPEQAGISSVVVVDGVSYVVDCGRSALTQYQRAGLKFGALRNIFLTHLHADHVADYYNFFLLGGVTPHPGGDAVPAGVRVYGPGRAGELPTAFGDVEVATVAPEDPTPGTVAMTDHCHRAFAYSSNVFLRDTGQRDPRDLVDAHDIELPRDVHADALKDRAPSMEPFIVMEDDLVRVSATLVPHGPVFPSYAFRFDTEHGSVTFSGDTRRSENLIRLARSSDVLVHEALRIPSPDSLTPVALDHMLQSHVLVGDVGEIAESAGVRHLVLSHNQDFGGTIDRMQWARLAQQNFGGLVTIGSDLASIAVA